MALTNKAGDLIVTNQLKIDIRVITKAQAWAEQVRGVYHLLYPYIVADFSHTDDIQQWVDQVFSSHTHTHTHGPSGPPIGGKTQITDSKGKSLLESNSVLGKVKKGLSDLKRLVLGIDKVNNRELK